MYCGPLLQDETRKNTGCFSFLWASFLVPVLCCWVGGRCEVPGATLDPELLSYTLGAWVYEVVCLHTPNHPPPESSSWSYPPGMLRRYSNPNIQSTCIGALPCIPVHVRLWHTDRVHTSLLRCTEEGSRYEGRESFGEEEISPTWVELHPFRETANVGASFWMRPYTLGKDRSRGIRCNGILFQGSVLGRSHRRICLDVPSLPGLIVIAPASERQDGVA